jgi:hypothetical protein
VVAVIVLVVVLGVSRTVLDATAPGTGARPLAGTANLKVPGWRPATDKAAIDLTEAMRLRLAGTPGLGAGASKTYAAAFRPTRARAAAGAGPHLIVLWIPKPDRLDVVNLVAGFRDGLRSQGYEDTSVSRTAAGAQMVCGTTPIAASCAHPPAQVIMVAESAHGDGRAHQEAKAPWRRVALEAAGSPVVGAALAQRSAPRASRSRAPVARARSRPRHRTRCRRQPARHVGDHPAENCIAAASSSHRGSRPPCSACPAAFAYRAFAFASRSTICCGGKPCVTSGTDQISSQVARAICSACACGLSGSARR